MPYSANKKTCQVGAIIEGVWKRVCGLPVLDPNEKIEYKYLFCRKHFYEYEISRDHYHYYWRVETKFAERQTSLNRLLEEINKVLCVPAELKERAVHSTIYFHHSDSKHWGFIKTKLFSREKYYNPKEREVTECFTDEIEKYFNYYCTERERGEAEEPRSNFNPSTVTDNKSLEVNTVFQIIKKNVRDRNPEFIARDDGVGEVLNFRDSFLETLHVYAERYHLAELRRPNRGLHPSLVRLDLHSSYELEEDGNYKKLGWD